MGSTKLWLPSLRSVASHRGALSMVLLGHWRSGRLRGGNFLYFLEGSLSLRQPAVVSFLEFVTPKRQASLMRGAECSGLHRHFGGLCGAERNQQMR